jgi:hypothetical protein
MPIARIWPAWIAASDDGSAVKAKGGEAEGSY